MILFWQSPHQGTKLIAAIGVALEHVEGGGAGRKKDNLTRPGQGARALDRIGQ